MTNFIPIFPLGVVVYPGEKLNLHVFEPRYKQLIVECHNQKKLFGIPVVINNKLKEYGSLVEISELSKIFDNGEMDIKTTGHRTFRILELIKEVPDKLYSGAIVSYPETYEQGNPEVMQKVMNNIRNLHGLLKISKEFKKEDVKLKVYEVAHHLGLTIEEEYKLLMLHDERQRQEYLKRHLAKVIPILAGMEQLKDKIKQNGHFKDLKGFDFSK
ncbi:MAG TPA: LON peptidase substrate-binding domain-containing protein [Chitinophagaceae bacterium]|jgi:Lon protease-like protein|nr:LON peptidase substrate-binding domain-containing protein [Chitinophagaceae bacterium]